MGAISAFAGWAMSKFLKGPVDNVLKGSDNNGNPQTTDVANIAAAVAGEHDVADAINTGNPQRLPWVTNQPSNGTTTLENLNPNAPNPSRTLENRNPAFFQQILNMFRGVSGGPPGGLPL